MRPTSSASLGSRVWSRVALANALEIAHVPDLVGALGRCPRLIPYRLGVRVPPVGARSLLAEAAELDVALLLEHPLSVVAFHLRCVSLRKVPTLARRELGLSTFFTASSMHSQLRYEELLRHFTSCLQRAAPCGESLGRLVLAAATADLDALEAANCPGASTTVAQVGSFFGRRCDWQRNAVSMEVRTLHSSSSSSRRHLLQERPLPRRRPLLLGRSAAPL